MSKWNYNQDMGNIGETIDGRALFHRRRDESHQYISEVSRKSLSDPKYLIDWVAGLMQLHRQLWGTFMVVKHSDGQTFNKYMHEELHKVRKKLMEMTRFHEKGDGQIHHKIDRDKMKELYLRVDQLQKQFAEIEYKKNLDLPNGKAPIDECKTAFDD